MFAQLGGIETGVVSVDKSFRFRFRFDCKIVLWLAGDLQIQPTRRARLEGWFSDDFHGRCERAIVEMGERLLSVPHLTLMQLDDQRLLVCPNCISLVLLIIKNFLLFLL